MTDFIILITDHRAKVSFIRQLHGFNSKTRCKNAVQRRRRAAALEMTKHTAARLFPGAFCDFAGHGVANSTKPKLARLNVALYLFAMFWSCAFRNHDDRSQTTSSLARLNHASDLVVIERNFRN